MQRLALNFICKNEGHIVARMLESAKGITDLIVVNDTGSTDDTQQVIRNFGLKYNIPTYIYERSFDNFGNSRNYALKKLRDTVDELHWDPEEVWGFWADCDEVLLVGAAFRKELIDKDFYNVMGEFDHSPFSRGSFFRLSKDFFWNGPVHEAIMWRKDDPITLGSLPGIFIKSDKTGHSWKGDIEAKYIRYAKMLEGFSEQDEHYGRWIFYSAQNYYTAATHSSNEFSKVNCLKNALRYYEKRANLAPSSLNNIVEREEQAYAQQQIGTVLEELHYPWPKVQEALIKSHMLDPLRGEPIMQILQHYMATKEWSEGYKLSLFAVNEFHGKSPLGQRFIGIEPAIYNWQFLWAHYLMCFYARKNEEMLEAYRRIKTLINDHPEYFTEQDILLVRTHTRLVLSLNRGLQRLKDLVINAFNIFSSKGGQTPKAKGLII